MKLPIPFRRKQSYPDPPPLPVPTFAQIGSPPSRLKGPSIVLVIGGGLLAYFGWPHSTSPPTIPAPIATPAAEPNYIQESAPEPKQQKDYAPRRDYVIHTGPRGGRYHFSASGKKVYERKRR